MQTAATTAWTDVCLDIADAAVGPFVLALKRFGASLKEMPNLAKYADTLQVRLLVAAHPSCSDHRHCSQVRAFCWPAFAAESDF